MAMLYRVFFVGVLAFWLMMNGLLLRSQLSGRNQIGDSVPVDAVWQKILTAPDISNMDIYDHEKKIGFCSWVANVGESQLASGKIQSEDYLPEGMIEQPTGYSLKFQGNAFLFSATNRTGFDATLMLSTNREWKDLRVRVNARPITWDIHAIAAARKVALKYDSGEGIWQKTFSFADLQKPETVFKDFAESFDLGALGTIGLPLLQKDSMSALALQVKWEAHDDRMRFGHSRVRVYCLETRLLGQHVYVYISRVGELLWVELPGNITLRNEAFSHF